MARTSNAFRADEKFPLSFDPRRQSFFRNFHQRSIDDLEDPLVKEFGEEGLHLRTFRPVQEMVELVKELVRLHEMTWRPSLKNPMLLYFPFMFVVPKPGWKLRNLTTRDVYEVKKVAFDEKREFTGAVLLTGGLSPPGKGTEEEPGRWDRLDWVEPDGKAIAFHDSWPEKEALEAMSLEGADQAKATALALPPTVTVHLVREEPGSVDKREFGPAKLGKPKLIGYEPDPFDPLSYRLAINWQWFETILQFDCWSALNREADRLVDWFRLFMNLYTWVIKLNGVSELRFWQQRGDLATQSFRDALPRRSVQYYVRTISVQPVRVRNLASVHIAARVHEGHSPIKPDEESITGGGLWETDWDRFHDETGNWLGGTVGIEDTRDFVKSFLNP